MRVYRDDQKFLNFRINVLLWANVIVFVSNAMATQESKILFGFM